MSFGGQELGTQGELIARSGLAEARVRDVTRRSPADVHRRAGWWPSAGTVARVLLVTLVVIVAVGWVLAALNS